jgi:hypothetical protein
MRKITWSGLIGMIPNEHVVQENDPIYLKYLAWKKLEEADERQLMLVGVLDNEERGIAIHPYRNQYWQPDAAIALSYYPYFGCSIYQYQQHGGLYFVYEVFGGHASEMRCRLIQRHLTVLDIPGKAPVYES